MAVTDKKKPKAPAELTLKLFDPGMTPLHQAGLGGLAATLAAMERRKRLGLIAEDALPGDWSNGKPPWEIKANQIALQFGESTRAADYLQKLFAFAFGIKDKLIDLPGTYRDELSRAVRLELQIGLTLTFLQYGKHRGIPRKQDMKPLYFDVDGDGIAEVEIPMQPCSWYLHQKAIGELKLTQRGGTITRKFCNINSAFNPGGIVRHEAFKTESRIQQPAAHGIATIFAIVGCLSLAMNRGVGVLLVPEVTDLPTFARSRPRMTPTTLRECRIAGPSDAALQAQVRVRAKGVLQRHGLAGIHTMRLRPTQWNKKQKTRVATVHVPPGADITLMQFDLALTHLPPRIYSYEDSDSRGRGQNRVANMHYVWRWKDSIVRPLVADNLASGRKWYDGFTRLMTERNGSHTPNHERVSYESEGLHAMIHEKRSEMTAEDERALIAAVHRAVNMQRGKIYADTMGVRARNENLRPSQACYNRWNRLMERLRLGLINAKTAEQTRRLLQDDIFGRAGTIKELQDDVKLLHVHRLIFHTDWQRLRDLTMLAVVSYKAPTKDDAPPGDDDIEREAAS